MPIPDPILDGDTFFKGVNARLDPGQLEAGFVSEAVNKRFTKGVAETRPGIKKMPWSNKQALAYKDTQVYSSGDYVLYSGRKVNLAGDDPVFANVNLSTENSDGSAPLAATSGPASQSAESGLNIATGQASLGKGPFFKATGTTTAGVNPVDSSNALQSNWADVGDRVFGYGTVYGAGVFRDPAGVEYLIVASSTGTYAVCEGNHSHKIDPCPVISAPVTFVQCFNVVVMMRGEELSPLVMSNIDTGFVDIIQEDSDTTLDENESDGTEPIPNGKSAIFFSNRLLVPHSRDLVAVSDYLNYTRYQPVMANFRINQGSEDELVALVKVDNNTIAAFKSNSIYVVSNVYGSTLDAVLDEVTRDYGAVSAKSTIQVGSDVWFLSAKKGICSLKVASHGKVNAVELPISSDIQPLIDRINWNHSDKAVAATYQNKYYCAVCLDGAKENNAVLVYDLLQQAWSGYDTSKAFTGLDGSSGIKEFIEMEFQGKRRLFFLSTDGFINLYDDDLTVAGFVDDVPKSTNSASADFGKIITSEVEDKVVTRGYSVNDISQKKWRSAEVHMNTSDPKFSITANYDGPEEDNTSLATNKTFSRTVYDKPFDKVDYTQSNTNNDFFTKFREDYSVKLAGETGGVDLILPTGSCSSGGHATQLVCENGENNRTWTYNTEDNGFDPDLHQTSVNKYRFRGSGRYIQLKVENTQGRLELTTVKVGALAGENLTRKEL
tara:strand:+ start:9297 stop:11456 length:2160 start_codon:yes stop_codon:yes gene_type:complete